MSDNQIDIIDQLADIKAGSALDVLRARRPVTKQQAQASWNALFTPPSDTEFSAEERFAVALFVAALHEDDASSNFYKDKLTEQHSAKELAQAIIKIAQENKAIGPYGHYPDGPLSAENVEGSSFSLPSTYADILTPRLIAALTHAHFLVFHPRDAAPARLKILTNAGWLTTDIITLSQLVSFLAFQLRVISGLKILATA
ncbi:CMD domain protein [Brucellaceae bacterium C25G]